ncbi:MAG: hypothetical protein ACOYJW_03375 [Candidatus Omnitrophota bacterium]
MSQTNIADEEYQDLIDFQNQYHQLYKSGSYAEEKGDYHLAVQQYEKGLKMVRGYGPETIFRSKLRTTCEKAGYYEKALVHTDWFLVKSNDKSPLWPEYLKTKQRLIAKIEAQKRETEPMASTSDTQLPPIKNIADFTKASYGDQKRYMEEKLPENTAILKLSKQAMLAEHAGDFKSAKESYEALLAQERAVTAAQGEVAWVMLHCAVQRTSEVTGDEVREKEMLVWIRDCMLVPDGQHHKYLNGLMPSVQDHLKERLRKFGLTS